MTKPRILHVAIPSVPFFSLFDYLAPVDCLPEQLLAGIRLEVPFGKRTKIAFLISHSTESHYPLEKLKPISQRLDDTPLLSEMDLRLLHWVSAYYHHPLGDVISAAFPVALRQGKAATLKKNLLHATTPKYYRLLFVMTRNKKPLTLFHKPLARLGYFYLKG